MGIEITKQEQENDYEQQPISEGECILYPVVLDTESLSNIKFDRKLFEQGMKDISYVAGMLTGIINCGVAPSLALDYIMNSENIKHNIQLTDKNNATTIEVSKVQAIKAEALQI